MFRAARRRTGIRRAFAHSSYLINLASPDPSAWAQAVTAFTDELERAEALGLSCVVIHPGSHMGAGLEAGLRRVIAALDQALARTSGCRVKVALENTAGGGNSLGRTFAELATLIDGAARPERIGVCVRGCTFRSADENGRMLSRENENTSLPVAASPITSRAKIEKMTMTRNTLVQKSPIQ